VLRAYDRIAPGALSASGHLSSHLAALLPELGPAPAVVDRLALAAALRDAFVGMAGRQPTAVFLDDLHSGDEATLELLPSLAEAAEDRPLLFLAAYQSDDVVRGHPLRRMRAALRRSGRLEELVVAPLDHDQVAELVSRVLGRRAGPRLVQRIFERTEGVPFVVEEFATALAAGGRLEEHADAVELPAGGGVAPPEKLPATALRRPHP